MMARFLSPVLSAQVIKPIPTLILNLTSSQVLVLVLVLSESSSWSLPAVGHALFTNCRSALSRSGFSFLPAVGPLCWCCFELLFVLDCPDLCPLPGVATCERRTPHYLCNMKPWLRQGLGCPRADPHIHHRTFSHVPRQNFPSEAAHHAPSNRPRLAEPPHALSRASRGLGDPSPHSEEDSSSSRHCAWEKR